MELQEQSLLPQVIRNYYETGELQEEYFQLNGKKEGEYKRYNYNGNLYAICNYFNGHPKGEYKSYHENGELKEIRNYAKYGNYAKKK